MRCTVLLFGFLGVLSLQAQQLEFFTARQGSSAVIQYAQREGFRDAVLVGVFYAGQIPTQQFSPRFDLETGKANYWGYAVRSAVRDTVLFYVAIRVPFLGFQVFPLSGLSSIPGISSEPLPTWWMDSDSLVILLRGEQNFRAFRRQYPDSLPDFVTLGMAMLPGMSSAVPVWTIVFLGSPQQPSTTMTCTAWKTSETDHGTQCVGGPSAVEDRAAAAVKLFPQPASRWVAVDVASADCWGFSHIWLEDLLGRRLQQWDWRGCQQRLELELSAGLYVVVLSGSRGQLCYPLVVAP